MSFCFHPENWGRFPIWLILFQMGWTSTTNQSMFGGLMNLILQQWQSISDSTCQAIWPLLLRWEMGKWCFPIWGEYFDQPPVTRCFDWLNDYIRCLNNRDLIDHTLLQLFSFCWRLQPQKLTWNLKIWCFPKGISCSRGSPMFMFHVGFKGCTSSVAYYLWASHVHWNRLRLVSEPNLRLLWMMSTLWKETEQIKKGSKLFSTIVCFIV